MTQHLAFILLLFKYAQININNIYTNYVLFVFIVKICKTKEKLFLVIYGHN